MMAYQMRKFLTIVLVFASPAFAQAPQQAPQPSANGQPGQPQAPENKITKTATFNDWVLNCRQTSADPKSGQVCELVQTLIVNGPNGQRAPFAQIALGKPKPDMPMQITVVVPNNVSFPSSIKIAVDEKDKSPLDLAWARCLPPGCFANANLKDDLIKKWRPLETQGKIAFKNGAGQDLALPISFKGLAQGYDALNAETKK